ncbi:MAG: hypothetical protein ACRCX8_19695 [Sarcina sp.]
MKSKELVIKQLDLLVEMAEHCINKKRTEGNSTKCEDCNLHWNFSVSSHGCFLCETVDYGKFIEDLESVCISQDIEYRDKLNKIASIFVTECE